MLNRKFITKILDPKFREGRLARREVNRFKCMRTREYAEYVVGTHVAGRDPTFKDDASKSYGYEPIDFMGAVMSDGSIVNKMFEFKQINHCLKFEGRDAAVDAVECVLLEWADDDRNIRSFDVDAIKAYAANAEAAYREQLKNEEAANFAEETEEKEDKDGELQ